ncbi:MAG: exodeoxyribonuclease I [Pseudomonadota bacterium]
MTDSFYWYDLETSGTDPRWDRIVQFAGIRTDHNLEVIGDEYCTYIQLPDDVLPNPDASLVTGITPQLTHRSGISEIEGLLNINKLFAEPQTCVAGYNSLRFDDEFMRHSLYRHMLDPYAREWQQGNSRWDLIDLVRATGGLRREGINWPEDEEGLPVYKLEELTKANGISHGHAHDAMSDVHATIGLARLIKQHQPKLFEYYFNLRHKKQVRKLLEPHGARLCVHVSGMYPRIRSGVAPIMSLARHPKNGNSVIVVDLASPIDTLLEMTAEEIGEVLFTAGAENRPPLKEVRLNRCPFIAPIEVLTEYNQQRLGIDMGEVRERAQRLQQAGIADKVMRVYNRGAPAPASDPDAGLYNGFLHDDDRSRCQKFHADLEQGRWRDMDYADPRLHTLAQRLKARSFPALLDQDEVGPWCDFVVEKLSGEGDWLNMARFEERLAELARGDFVAAEAMSVLRALAEHAQDLKQRYML